MKPAFHFNVKQTQMQIFDGCNEICKHRLQTGNKTSHCSYSIQYICPVAVRRDHFVSRRVNQKDAVGVNNSSLSLMRTFPSYNLQINSSSQKKPTSNQHKNLFFANSLAFFSLAFPSPFFRHDTPKCGWKRGDANPLANLKRIWRGRVAWGKQKIPSSNCFCKFADGCHILLFPLTISKPIAEKLKCVLEILWLSRAEDKWRYCLFLYLLKVHHFTPPCFDSRPPSSQLPLLLLLTLAWLVPKIATFLNGSC